MIRADANGNSVLRGLLWFDVTALTAGANVAEATLYLATGSGMDAASSDQVSFFALLERWTEGTSTQQIGVSNWTDRTATDAWSSAGAGPSSRQPQPFAQLTMPDLSTEYAISVPAALVQSWLDTPNQNHGMVFEISGVDGVSLLSAESTADARRPMLAVTFTQ